MAKGKTFLERAEELRGMLEKYNGVPSQSEDRIAHAAIMYYVKNYADDPYIKKMIEDFNIEIYGKRNSLDYKIKEIESSLKEYGSIQELRYNKTLYNRVYKYIDLHFSSPEIKRIGYLYGFAKCIPIPQSKYHSHYYYNSYGGAFIFGTDDNFIEWKIKVTFEYVEYVFATFQELPSAKTLPMVFLKYVITQFYEKGKFYEKFLYDKSIIDFCQRMISLGCNHELFTSVIESTK